MTHARFVSGKNPVREYLRSGYPVTELYIQRDRQDDEAVREIVVLAKARKIRYNFVDRERLDRMAGEHHHGIVLAGSGPPPVDLADILARTRQKGELPFVVIVDGVEDPHNLGAIVRTAEAAGAHAVVIPRHRAAGVTPTVIQASAGAAMMLPVIHHANLVQTIRRLKEDGMWVIGSDGGARQSYLDMNVQGPVALVVGKESTGISRLVKGSCDALVRIPMKGRVGSLNASVAAGILIFEILRRKGVSNDTGSS